jgi:hypothetical protein
MYGSHISIATAFSAIFCHVGELGVIAGQALRLAIFGDKFHRRALEVTDDRVIPMALAKRLLIDADVGERAELLSGSGRVRPRDASRPMLHPN